MKVIDFRGNYVAMSWKVAGDRSEYANIRPEQQGIVLWDSLFTQRAGTSEIGLLRERTEAL